jgi:hypothetical protein
MGRGVYATEPIARGTCLVRCEGWLARNDELDEDWLAMQVGPDLWLCSAGDCLDECMNHSCDPNAGFIRGEPVLYALCEIAVGEQIVWDYSTSIAEAGWTLECRCGSEKCRTTVRSWWELEEVERDRLEAIALRYLRNRKASGKESEETFPDAG